MSLSWAEAINELEELAVEIRGAGDQAVELRDPELIAGVEGIKRRLSAAEERLRARLVSFLDMLDQTLESRLH